MWRNFLSRRHAVSGTPVHTGASMARRDGPVGLTAILLAAGLFCGSADEASAQWLKPGDVSLGVSQSFARYNRYWYHYNGDTDCNGLPCSRANLNSYDGVEVPVIDGQSADMPPTTLAVTTFGAEYGALDRLVLSLRTELAYTSPSSTTISLGDTRLGATWQATPDAPIVLALTTALKVPGTYAPNAVVAAGGGQTDLSFGGILWGHAFRHKLVWNVGWGYRFRFPFSDPVFVKVSNSDGPILSTPVVGPSDEAYLDFTTGVFASRKTYLFLNGSVNNAFGGVNIDEYYTALFAGQDPDGAYEVDGDPSDLLTIMEEDYILLGVGVLFRVRYSATLYFNYALKVLGQNTPAFFVPENAGLPIGKLLVGMEYTFGTRGPAKAGAEGGTNVSHRMAGMRPGWLADAGR